MADGKFDVRVKRKVERGLADLPESVQSAFVALVEDLRESGPIQREWPNFSALGPGRYHCHLAYRWVACWTHAKGTVEIEVYYVGSRQGAPY